MFPWEQSMDLWRGSFREFVRSAESGALAGDMTGQFVRIHHATPSPAEVRSWGNSLPVLARSLRGLDSADIGVQVIGTGASVAREPAATRDLGVATEYYLPLAGNRIDVLLCGADGQARPQALVVELKQWSSARLADEFETNVIVDGYGERLHPSQQALGYAEWLADYHGAFVERGVGANACAYLHEMPEDGARSLRDPRFESLLARAPLFTRATSAELCAHVAGTVGHGGGMRVLDTVTGAGFRPSRNVLQNLEEVLRADARWHLLDAQQQAYNAIFAEVKKLKARKGRAAILVRGGPGTGKSVIAVQLLADALRLGLNAAHSTGGKAFTTNLRGRFKGADKLFQWNMNLSRAPLQGLDLLLVDEAHRIRETSNTRWTKASHRADRPQVDELLDAAKVTVFFLDENQFVRPDEVGRTALVVERAASLGVPLRSYDLAAQFRCGGAVEYVQWIDALLGFGPAATQPWGERYRFALADAPDELERMVASSVESGEEARILAGFCWPWSEPNADGSLARDVRVGGWSMPWNRKRDEKKRYRPDNDPYTLWATTAEGREQVGCVYSAQGFEYPRVGVIWGHDLVRRGEEWVAQKAHSHDRFVKGSKDMCVLVRNAYRVLLTRGTLETRVLILDDETREHVRRSLARLQE
jgi:hypothetical protein